MPSFDIVSNVDDHELTNAIDQANRVLGTRFDFKGIDAKFKHEKDQVVIMAPSEFQINQMKDILFSSLTKRGIDIKALAFKPIQTNLSQIKQEADIKQGIDQTLGKKIGQLIKAEKMKVQTSIQDQQVRVTGKKRDDLQETIALLKDQSFDQPLQFVNFRD